MREERKLAKTDGTATRRWSPAAPVVTAAGCRKAMEGVAGRFGLVRQGGRDEILQAKQTEPGEQAVENWQPVVSELVRELRLDCGLCQCRVQKSASFGTALVYPEPN